MSQAIEVQRIDATATKALDQAVRLFTEAFEDNALFMKAFPRDETRRAVLNTLFTALVDDSVRFGGIHAVSCEGELAGVLMWYPPGAYPMTPLRIFRQLHHFLKIAAMSPFGIMELRRAQQSFDRRRPKEPHCHACFLGGRTGDRVGVYLAHALMMEADLHGWPIYLETQNERSMKLYRRMGSELLADGFECFPGGPVTWTMMRPPYAAQERLRRTPLLERETSRLAAE